MAKEWTEAEERALRYRVNVSSTTKGVKSWETTVDGSGYTIAEILDKSDELCKALEVRYPAPKE